MAVPISRRAVVSVSLAAVAAVVAGCTRALRSAPTSAPSSADAASTGQSPTSRTPTAPDSTNEPPTTRPATSSTVAPSSTSTSTSTPIGATTRTVTTRSRPSARSVPTTAPFLHLPAAGAPAIQVASGPRTIPALALTFHGAGDPALARQILAIAGRAKVEITVMAVGTWLDQYPTMAAEITAGGHELGNHTWSHLDINSLSMADMQQEIVRCRDILRRQVTSPGRYFRQSQSQTASTQLRAVAGQAGYRVCLSYDLDSMDWTDPGAAAVRDNLKTATSGSIVSMHLGHQSTVDALPGILVDLAARHLTPVTVSTLLGY